MGVETIGLFIYLLGANQKDDRWCEKEMRDQCNIERVYVLHKLWQA